MERLGWGKPFGTLRRGLTESWAQVQAIHGDAEKGALPQIRKATVINSEHVLRLFKPMPLARGSGKGLHELR